MPASRTALLSAALRMTHRTDDDPPPVFDDPFAERLLGADAAPLAERVRALPEAFRLFLRASMVGRSRVVEERLRSASRPARYVAVGAGLDTLAWMVDGLETVEIDQPDSAADKRERMRAAALEPPAGWRQLPCDLAQEPLADVLQRAVPDDGHATVISWLGVTQYLPPEVVGASMHALAGTPPGTEVVFTSVLPEREVPAEDLDSLHRITTSVREDGEPVRTTLAHAEVAALVRESGLELVGDVGAPGLIEPLFAGRRDGLRANAASIVTVART